MSILIISVIVITSFALSALFIIRDAKSFALAPPTPLIDLDRMYDYIFSNLDEETGKSITPVELKQILESFIKLFSEQQLIAEDISANNLSEEKYTPDRFAAKIKSLDPQLDVKAIHIKNVMNLALTYLSDIGALT